MPLFLLENSTKDAMMNKRNTIKRTPSGRSLSIPNEKYGNQEEELRESTEAFAYAPGVGRVNYSPDSNAPDVWKRKVLRTPKGEPVRVKTEIDTFTNTIIVDLNDGRVFRQTSKYKSEGLRNGAKYTDSLKTKPNNKNSYYKGKINQQSQHYNGR